MKASQNPPYHMVINKTVLNGSQRERNLIKKAYESSVDLICSPFFNLFEKVDKEGPIIITSDNSELMEEDGNWFHENENPKLKFLGLKLGMIKR